MNTESAVHMDLSVANLPPVYLTRGDICIRRVWFFVSHDIRNVCLARCSTVDNGSVTEIIKLLLVNQRERPC